MKRHGGSSADGMLVLVDLGGVILVVTSAAAHWLSSFSVSDLVVVLESGTDWGHRLGGSSGFLYWFWNEEFVWPKGVYGADWF